MTTPKTYAEAEQLVAETATAFPIPADYREPPETEEQREQREVQVFTKSLHEPEIIPPGASNSGYTIEERIGASVEKGVDVAVDTATEAMGEAVAVLRREIADLRCEVTAMRDKNAVLMSRLEVETCKHETAQARLTVLDVKMSMLLAAPAPSDRSSGRASMN